jgi:triosephosphate isomerase
MKRQKNLVVGNWKMNPTMLEEAKEIVSGVKRGVKDIKKTQIVLCPPFIYLQQFTASLKAPLYLGAQNANHETLGSFTGEVSYAELSDMDVQFVILGHSERRKVGETDEIINKKVKSVVNSKMNAILCVGESSRDEHGDFYAIIKEQLHLGLRDVSKRVLGNVVIAYEPVWAIGAKEAMTPRDLHEMTIYIKKVLQDMFGTLSSDVRVIYGGSVNKFNTELLVKEGNVSGLLIGRESLKPRDFVEIIKIVDSI